MDILSVITIREGSKGCKNKCIRKINEKMVFEYTLEYAESISKANDEIIISSDSQTVREYCEKERVLFSQRPKRLARGNVELEDVLYYVYNEHGKDFDAISLLYGNVPTRYAEEFNKARKILDSKGKYDCVLSMQKVEKYNPDWMFKLDRVNLPKKKHKSANRQTLPQYMIHDGHTILFKSRHFLDFMARGKEKKFMYESFGERIKPLLNETLVIDIDTERDLEMAKSYIGGKI